MISSNVLHFAESLLRGPREQNLGDILSQESPLLPPLWYSLLPHLLYLGLPQFRMAGAQKETAQKSSLQSHFQILNDAPVQPAIMWENGSKMLKGYICVLGHRGSGSNPPACRRVLWILLVRSCTVCFVFCLCLNSFCLVIFASSSSPSSSSCFPSSSFVTMCWA